MPFQKALHELIFKPLGVKHKYTNDFTKPEQPPDYPTTDVAEVKSLGISSANALGLYDMSGNVAEWCFIENISW